MAVGDLVFFRQAIDLTKGIQDSAVTTFADTLFPAATYDILDTSVHTITQSNGVTHAVIVIVARAIA